MGTLARVGAGAHGDFGARRYEHSERGRAFGRRQAAVVWRTWQERELSGAVSTVLLGHLPLPRRWLEPARTEEISKRAVSQALVAGQHTPDVTITSSRA